MSGEDVLPAVDAAPEVPEPEPEQAAADGAAAEAGEANGDAQAPAVAQGEAAAEGEAGTTEATDAAAEGAAEGASLAKEGEAAAKEGTAKQEPPPPRVFFSGAPLGVRKEDVEDVFGFYGKVARVELFTDFRTRQTRGCGFVHYVERRSAEDAIAALGGAYTFPGGAAPMTVRWEETVGERKRKAEGEPDEDRRQLFLAKITRSIPEEHVKAVLEHYGNVVKLSMFKPTPDAVFHKGCGVVTFSTQEEAETAMKYLDEVYTWEGMKEPMVAKFNESDANKRRREDDMRFGPQYVSLEPPPQGCESDALKLYVGNIPTAATVEEIRDTFKGFGRIIQILVARDKASGAPKGSAYIWYARRRDADFAIKRLNGSTSAFAEAWARAAYEAAQTAATAPAEEATPATADAAPAEAALEVAAAEAEPAAGAEATAAEPAAAPAAEPAAEAAAAPAADGTAAAAEGAEEKKEEGAAAEGAAKEEAEAKGEEAKEAKEGEEKKDEEEMAKSTGPKPLVVTIAQSSVQTLRPGDRPPAWMRGPPLAAPPPFRPPFRPMGGPPPGWGAPPVAAPGWGAPPPGAWGAPVAPAPGGYDPYGQQAAYGQPPPGQPQPGYPSPAAPAAAYGAYGQQPSPAAPVAGYGAYGQQAPAQEAYQQAPQQGYPPAQAPPAQAYPGYGGYPQQAPAAQPPGAYPPQQAPGGVQAQHPVGGYNTYPGQPGQPAPQQQQQGYYGQGY